MYLFYVNYTIFVIKILGLFNFIKMQNKNSYLVPLILVTSLFFLWGIANSLNGTLISHFQASLDLSRAQAGVVDSAFYIGYFLMALPAGYFMKKFGYKNGILLGLSLYAIGAALFYPAANVRAFGFFLFNLFTIATGLAFLETAANSYVAILGDESRAAHRVNFAQSFNGISIILGPLIGGLFVFSDKDVSKEQLAAMPFDQAESIRAEMASSVQMPYLILAGVVFFVALLFFFTKMPEIKNDNPSSETQQKSIFSLLKNKHLLYGFIAQFVDVGAQACIWGYFVDLKIAAAAQDNFSLVNQLYPITSEMSAKQIASFHASFALAIFMVGRFAGLWLMNRIAPHIVLGLYGIAAALMCFVVMQTSGIVALVALTSIYFFHSIMFPTIFALATKGLGEQTQLASGIIIMGVGGGAVFAPFMGLISKQGVQFSMIVPLCCFAFIAWYGFKGSQYKPEVEA